MSTPSTPDATKSIRVHPELHARLQKLSEGLNGASMAATIEWLLSPGMVRVSLSPEQRARWKTAADANGQSIADFVTARVEAALQYGADPGALRMIHDMVYALTRSAGIVPQQHATPGSHRQVITVPVERGR